MTAADQPGMSGRGQRQGGATFAANESGSSSVNSTNCWNTPAFGLQHSTLHISVEHHVSSLQPVPSKHDKKK